MSTTKYWQAVNRALHEEMARDERVLVIGEDVAGPGGPFGATKGLLDALARIGCETPRSARLPSWGQRSAPRWLAIGPSSR